jgi:aspartate aminotransferase
VGQVAAEAAIDSSDEYMDGVFNEYLSRRDFVTETLNEIPGIFCTKPKGAFYIMAKLPVDDAEKFSMWMLSDFEYNGNTVMLAPGAGFYTEGGLGKQEVRIAYVLNKEQIKIALDCLAKGLQKYPGRIKEKEKTANYSTAK